MPILLLFCYFVQDVSEFTHKLLEWLEDAFKLDTSAQPSQDTG